MSKQVLVVRKNDKTIHVLPIENKASIESYNNRQSPANKWKIELMDADEAKKLPFVDENFVTAADAISQAQQLKTVVAEKDARLLELEAQLAEYKKAQEPKQLTAQEVVDKINEATTPEQVNEIADGDTRKTVIDAASKKIESLSK